MDVTPLDLRGAGRGAADAAPHFSVSQAQMVERCPLQWRFKYIEGLRSSRTPEPGSNWANGIALDDAITAACRGRSDEAYRLSRPVQNAYVAFMKWHGDTYPGACLPEVQTRIVTVVPLTQEGINGRREPGDTVEFFGYLDLLYPDGHLVDIKFADKADGETVIKWQRQLSSYAAGDPRIKRASILRFGKSGLLDDMPLPLDVFDFGDWAARQVKRGPGARVHPPTPGKACSWCDYRRQCVERCAETFTRDDEAF